MKTMIVALLFTFWLPALQAGAEEVSSKPLASQESKLVKWLSRANPEWSLELGGGSAFHPGLKETGQLEGYGNSPLFTMRVGYSPVKHWNWAKYAELQGEYANLSGFGVTYQNVTGAGAGTIINEQNNTLSITAISLNLKLKAPLKVKMVALTPYVVVGVGRARANLNVNVRATNPAGAMLRETDLNASGSGNCLKIGGGMDVDLYKNIYLFSDFSFVKMGVVTMEGAGDSFNMSPYASMAVGGLGLRF